MGGVVSSEKGRRGARHIRLNRPVALKMILGGGHAAPQVIQRFRLEAKAAARM
jgi:hypothetical protein